MVTAGVIGPGKRWEKLPVNSNGKVLRKKLHVRKGDTVQVGTAHSWLPWLHQPSHQSLAGAGIACNPIDPASISPIKLVNSSSTRFPGASCR